jgi:hypothetical protein
LNFQDTYKVISVCEDSWNFNAEIEIRDTSQFSLHHIDTIFLNIAEMIYTSKKFTNQLFLSYYSNFIDDNDFNGNLRIVIEADILKQIDTKLIAEIYLYGKSNNNFIAKSFFVYENQ